MGRNPITSADPMRCHVPFAFLLLGSTLCCACRTSTTAAAAEPRPAATALDEARLACGQGDLDACDRYELERALCLERPHDGPQCDHLRRLGEIPPEPPPLFEDFGCRPTLGPVGPRAIVCLAEDRLTVRFESGAWEQWQVTQWRREDTRDRVVWVAELAEAPPVFVTLAAPMRQGWPPRVGDSSQPVYHVAGQGGLLRADVGARDPEAEEALLTVPRVEEVCRQADACEQAVAAALARASAPASTTAQDEEEPHEVGVAAASCGPRTLQRCQERLSTAVNEAHAWATDADLPAACGTPDTSAGQAPIPVPPH